MPCSWPVSDKPKLKPVAKVADDKSDVSDAACAHAAVGAAVPAVSLMPSHGAHVHHCHLLRANVMSPWLATFVGLLSVASATTFAATVGVAPLAPHLNHLGITWGCTQVSMLLGFLLCVLMVCILVLMLYQHLVWLIIVLGIVCMRLQLAISMCPQFLTPQQHFISSRIAHGSVTCGHLSA